MSACTAACAPNADHPTGAWDMQKFLLDITHAGGCSKSPAPDSPVSDAMRTAAE